MDKVENIGSAYDLTEPSVDTDLTDVVRGTPTGEMLRRYWQPIELSETVQELPLSVRVLGEDLILFRTKSGEPGLVHPRCCHRGTSLLFGRTEKEGIRCCYHGWLFNPQGVCLEQPCEPNPTEVNTYFRQPWYPVEERYGLVFAYLGPPEQKPQLPQYDVLENLVDGEYLRSNGNSIGAGGPKRMPCNWFQTHENIMDPYHVLVLHSSFSDIQFTQDMGRAMSVTYHETPTGMYSIQLRKLEDGSTLRRQTEAVLPNVRIVADPRLNIMGASNNVAWTLPVDSTNTRIFTVFKFGNGKIEPERLGEAAMYGGKTWFELDDVGHQRFPGDFEAQVGQGAITWHSEEHLAFSDEGVREFRKLHRAKVREVSESGRVKQQAEIKVTAGNFIDP